MFMCIHTHIYVCLYIISFAEPELETKRIITFAMTPTLHKQY